MPSKEFTFGFVLSAAMNSSFASSFAKASREVDELRKYMDKLGEETQQLQKAFGAGIINEKTFNTAVMQKFQSTHPMRGATEILRCAARKARDFNPRTPCGVRRFLRHRAPRGSFISIHAPHAGCDLPRVVRPAVIPLISIHAPHAGCDVMLASNDMHICNFNPRTP